MGRFISQADDLEPLFNYRRVQPPNLVNLDDDDSEPSLSPFPKKRKFINPLVNKVDDDVEVVKAVNLDDDWLPPPPKVSVDDLNKLGEDSTLRELRKKKQEFVSSARSAKDILQEVEESVKKELTGSVLPSLDSVNGQAKKPCPDRAKIVISIQDKDGPKQFRIYRDDKFERLFKMYASKAGIDLRILVFLFDGDKISPAATPESLDMEDDDMIEVHVKKV